MGQGWEGVGVSGANVAATTFGHASREVHALCFIGCSSRQANAYLVNVLKRATLVRTQGRDQHSGALLRCVRVVLLDSAGRCTLHNCLQSERPSHVPIPAHSPSEASLDQV